MKTRFASVFESPDAGEGVLKISKYSTERSPTTALLCEAARTVVLPVLETGDEPAHLEPRIPTRSEAGCSVQEH